MSNFLWNYYQSDGISGDNWYEDRYLYSLSQKIESDSRYQNKQKYVISLKAAPYIYVMLGSKVSPQEYKDTVQVVDYGNRIEVTKIADYHFIYIRKEFTQALKDQEDKVFIIMNISNLYENYINQLLEEGYNREDYGYYTILAK